MSYQEINRDFFESSHERDFNLLYVEVNPTIKKGFTKSKKETQHHKISNLAIYNIETDQLAYFFRAGSINNIKYYFYEKSYNEDGKKIEFNELNYLLTNNTKIEKRDLVDILFVVTEIPETEEYELWVSSKKGTNKRLVKKFSKKIDWQIDVYNQKFLFLHKLENGVKIEAINWDKNKA